MLKRFAQNMNTSTGTNWGRKISMIALIFSLISGAFVAAFSASRPELPPIAALFLFITAIVISILIAQLFFDLEGWFEQRDRDIEADRIFKSLSENDDSKVESFILYLRPFISTNKIGADQPKMMSFRPDGIGGATQFILTNDRVEFEEEVEKALRPLGKLIALGKPLEHMGAGRVRVADEVWQDAIKLLIDKAEMIVLLPSPRPGTSWEVEHLLTSGALEKTIVVDPPNDRGSVDKGYDPISEWAGVRTTFAEHGFSLPEDDEEGSLIIFGDQKEPVMTSKIGLGGENQVRRFARELQKKLRVTA
ncbi:hypothetical protein [Hirschia litorea]|uniref:TIR domain-containing protein n=1 Tax=Hirschia litorea TaxID=1199156 RepID=A0ABW2IJF9_9PROT